MTSYAMFMHLLQCKSICFILYFIVFYTVYYTLLTLLFYRRFCVFIHIVYRYIFIYILAVFHNYFRL